MMWLSKIAYLSTAVILSSLGLSSCQPVWKTDDGTLSQRAFNVTQAESSTSLVNYKRQNEDFELRIMPLGASIMSGVGSSGNGG